MLTKDQIRQAEAEPLPLPFWQCSWCGQFYSDSGYIPAPPVAAKDVSHGICKSCAKAMLRNLWRKK